MARPAPFEEMFNLEIGQHMLVSPKPDETLDHLLARIKKRASSYLPFGKSYVSTKDGQQVKVERVELGKNKKLREWEAMRFGERKLLAVNPTDKQVKDARNTADHLNRKLCGSGYWEARVVDRCLYAICLMDEEVAEDGIARRKHVQPSTELERLASLARYFKGTADRMRRDGRDGCSAGAEVLLDMAAVYDEKLSELNAQIEELKACGQAQPRSRLLSLNRSR